MRQMTQNDLLFFTAASSACLMIRLSLTWLCNLIHYQAADHHPLIQAQAMRGYILFPITLQPVSTK
jgi:hypothetical protein